MGLKVRTEAEEGTRFCDECGGRLHTNRFERDHGIWVWCGDCGLMEDETRVNSMTDAGFFSWVKSAFSNYTYRDLVMLQGLVGRMQHADALKVWIQEGERDGRS